MFESLYLLLFYLAKEEPHPIGMTFLCRNVQADLNDGLVAYYPFNGNANDESGNGYDGTVDGANLTKNRFGREQTAYNFNGADSSILVSDRESLKLTSLSVSVWYKADTDIANAGVILVKGGLGKDNNSTDANYSMRIYNENKLLAMFEDTHSKNYVLQTAGLSDQWHHAVFTYDQQHFRLFIDGSLVKSELSSVVPAQNTLPLMIGNITDSSSSKPFKGDIDDIRIYNRALLELEIQQLYGENSNLNDGLVAYYPFNGNANDESGNGNNGAINGATLTTNRHGNSNSAYSFDGDRDYIDTGARTQFNCLHNGSSFSVSLWEKHDINIDRSGLIGNVTGVDRPGIWYILMDYGKTVYLGIGRYTPYPVVAKKWVNAEKEHDNPWMFCQDNLGCTLFPKFM